jgi:hypothetical protein
MNPLVKKEVRLLLPAWIAAMLLASTPAWLACFSTELLRTLGGDALTTSTGFFFLLGILLLGVAPFGQEYSFKTSGLLLSQPLERERIWRVKISTMAVAFASVIYMAASSWLIFYVSHPFQVPDLVHEYKVALVGAAVFFSGGLWTTLLFRQVTAGFWFTFLVPAAILTCVGNLSDHFQWSDRTFGIVLAVVLGLYSVAGFFGARRLFFRAQDVQWTGGNIFFPWRKSKKFSDHTSAIVPGGLRGRFVALAWKEIQLHEASLFIAAILFVLHLATIPLRLVVTNPDVKFVMQTVWSLWLLMPMLIGGTAVAEERRTGTLESQLCLPVSRSAQFSFKFFVGLILSLILGAAVPSLVEHTRNFGNTNWINYWVFIAAFVIYFISFYASTLSRSTLQALGMAIGIPVFAWASLATFCLLYFPFNDRFGDNAGWTVLAILMGVPSLLLVLARLMFWNFKWLHHEWRLWRRNAAVIAGFFILLFVFTNAIFYRTWEFLTPADYPHGPARLSHPQLPKITVRYGVISALLPDGRLWVETLAFNHAHGNWEADAIAPDQCKARFVGGSNWVDVAQGFYKTLAVKSDGSLWGANQMMEARETKGWRSLFMVRFNGSQSDFTRIGSGTNWLQVAGGGGQNGFLLLKTDGSLWILQTNWSRMRFPFYDPGLPDSKMQPVQLGQATNWTELFMEDMMACAKDRDGNIWEWEWAQGGTNNNYRLEQNTNRDIGWLNFNNFYIAIGTNGELWVTPSGSWVDGKFVPNKKTRLGGDTKWSTVASYYGGAIVALRSDGTLWEWSQLSQLENRPEKIRGKQLGNHSDWVGLASEWGGVALAADGSLWDWQPGGFPLLTPSRKPVYLGNIFNQSN